MQIEITPRWDYDRSGHVRYVFEKRYIDFMHSLQIDIETIVPVVCEKPRTLDGLMLTGGNDLAIFNSDSLCRRRDVYELAKIEQYTRAGKPIFGICRGAQLLSHYFGSKLERIQNHAGTSHNLMSHTDLTDLTQVNSYHHFGITELATELTSLATSSDGTVEAFEADAKRILGIMWHPERDQCHDQKLTVKIQNFLRIDK